MGRYKIRVNVEIVECDEPSTSAPQQVNEGLFEFNISAEAVESAIAICAERVIEQGIKGINNEESILAQM